MEKATKPKFEHMNRTIFEQLIEVRDGGEANMLCFNAVQQVAMREKYYELVNYITDHKSEYADFILHGKEEDVKD
jgi:hypothetical protein